MSVPVAPLEAPPAAPRLRPARWGDRLLALVGELLILAGAVIGLYVVWQLFYTDVTAAREQQAVLDGLEWAYEPIVAPTASADDPGIIADGDKQDPATAPVMVEPDFGVTFATLYVPRWGEDFVKPISQGVTRREILDILGIGHYPGTAMPGEVGNFAISAHRTTYGKPFNRIAELKVGDALVVQTQEAWYVYRMTEHLIVQPNQVDVIAPVPGSPDQAPTGQLITLTSCHPMYSAAQRFIVHGELDYWAPLDAGVPAELVANAQTEEAP